MKRIIVLALTTFALVVVSVGVAFAHAQIDHCTPAVGSVVTSAPTQVVCVMTEEIDTKLSTIKVVNASNAQVDKKDGHVDLNDPDHKTLVVTLNAGQMQDGVYTVVYHAVTPDDGGITDGQFQFTVGSGPTPGPTKLVLSDVSGAPTTTPSAQSIATTAPTTALTAVSTAPAATPTTSTPSTLPTSDGETTSLYFIVGALVLVVLAIGLATLRFVKR